MTPATQEKTSLEERWRWRLIALSVGLYLAMCLAAFLAVRRINGGHFVFGLDDPYIHLALAQQIAHGHYGINPTEASSPSSSFLWPLLLASFALTRWAVLGTLLLNVLCGVGAAWLIGELVAAWPGTMSSREEVARRGLSVVALLMVADVGGLTYIGMEHMLQTMLALACAWGVIACLRERRIPLWCLATAAVGPWIRYESLALTLAMCAALWGQGRRRAAALTWTAGVAPLLAFSAFLHGLGLPLLPTSVIVKRSVPLGGHSFVVAYVRLWLIEFTHILVEAERGPLFVLLLTLVGLCWAAKQRTRRYALGGAAVAVAAHLLLGAYGWPYRYEVYILAFAAAIVLYVVHERPRMLLGWYALGLMACSMPYLRSTMTIHLASHEIYRQQFQTARLMHDFYHGNVAVEDLGLVSFDRPKGEYVLDLLGLGSVEAARQLDKSPAWMDAVTTRHDVGLVALYGNYKDVPQRWMPLGRICLEGKTDVVADPCVLYYATELAKEPETERAFGAFVKTLPADVTVTKIP